MRPTTKLSGVLGVTAMDDNTGAGTTVKVTTGLVIQDRAAVTLVLPVATLVTKPNEDMVAIVLSELVQVV